MSDILDTLLSSGNYSMGPGPNNADLRITFSRRDPGEYRIDLRGRDQFVTRELTQRGVYRIEPEHWYDMTRDLQRLVRVHQLNALLTRALADDRLHGTGVSYLTYADLQAAMAAPVPVIPLTASQIAKLIEQTAWSKGSTPAGLILDDD